NLGRKAALDVDALVVRILLRHSKFKLEEKLVFWRVLIRSKGRADLFEGTLVHRGDEPPAVKRISRQTIRLPDEQAVSLSPLEECHNASKYGSASFMCRLLLSEDACYGQPFALRIVGKLPLLRLNREDLFVFGLRRLSAIKEVVWHQKGKNGFL